MAETRLVSAADALSPRLVAGVSASPTVKGIAAATVSSSITRSGIGLRTGAALMVTVKERVKEPLSAWPSLTVTRMVAVPLAPGTGVNVSVPVVAGLVYKTLGVGTRAGL